MLRFFISRLNLLHDVKGSLNFIRLLRVVITPSGYVKGALWFPFILLPIITAYRLELYRNIHVYMFFNHHVDAGLKTRDDEVIEPVENFKYLGMDQ